MTKKLTKAQLFEIGMEIVASGSLDSQIQMVTPSIELPALTHENILERAEIAQFNAMVKALEAVPQDTWIDPIKWVDETPTIDQAMKSLVTTKSMKQVRTVKTGVGQQILQHIADGVLSNKEIVAKVLEDNPLRKTTYACVAWYQSQVRAGKIDLPKAIEV